MATQNTEKIDIKKIKKYRKCVYFWREILGSESQTLQPAAAKIPTNPPKRELMEKSEPSMSELKRVSLSEVVSDCVKRWFDETLKEAKSGDFAMQVLVGQMYFNGYGVSRDSQKGRIWINKASRVRSSAWKVGEKHPGYNASDSDSDVAVEDTR